MLFYAGVDNGDTVEIVGERIRLNGIDTPEANQSCLDDTGKQWRCGEEATLALRAIIGNNGSAVPEVLIPPLD